MPSRSWNTSTWPSVAGPAPMPITGTSISPISSSVTALGIASKTIAKQPASCSASASAAMRAAARALRPWAFQPPSAVEVWGVRPTWPITGMPAPTIARARLAGSLAAALQLDDLAAALLDHPHGGRDRLLVGDLIGAEGQVADQQRACCRPRLTARVSTSMSVSSTGVVAV